MWIKTMDGDLLMVDGQTSRILINSFGHVAYQDKDLTQILLYKPIGAEAQEVLDYIWHRLEMNKNTCDLTRFKNREAERSAEWPGCEYTDKPKVHRNFEYEGIPEADK